MEGNAVPLQTISPIGVKEVERQKREIRIGLERIVSQIGAIKSTSPCVTCGNEMNINACTKCQKMAEFNAKCKMLESLRFKRMEQIKKEIGWTDATPPYKLNTTCIKDPTMRLIGNFFFSLLDIFCTENGFVMQIANWMLLKRIKDAIDKKKTKTSLFLFVN